MYFTAFFATLAPIGMLFEIVMLVILYWLHKYNLLRRYSVLNDLSRYLAIEMIEMLEYLSIIFIQQIFKYLIYYFLIDMW